MRPNQPTTKRSGAIADPSPDGGRVLVARDAGLELDAEANDAELPRRRYAEAHELVAHLRAHGHERVGHAGEGGLDDPETSDPAVPKYPRRTWPWKVCTTTRGRRPPARMRSHAPDCSCLGGVRVEDIRSQPPDQPRQVNRRDRVSER